jgi:hypothetical protein
MNEIMKTTFQILVSTIIVFIVEFSIRIPERLKKELSNILQIKNDKKRIQRV